jgi:rhodanese-related sulfurtransferase
VPRLLLVLPVLLLAVLLSACEATKNPPAAGSGDSQGGARERVAVSGGSFTRVSPEELKSLMRKEDLLLVNTHVPFEGDIPGTDLSIPYDKIGRNLDRLPRRGEKVVLYCRSGRMSALAARTLVKDGYENVWDLEGGMVAWEKAGFRLEGT